MRTTAWSWAGTVSEPPSSAPHCSITAHRGLRTAVRRTQAAKGDCFSPRLATTPAFAAPLPPQGRMEFRSWIGLGRGRFQAREVRALGPKRLVPLSVTLAESPPTGAWVETYVITITRVRASCGRGGNTHEAPAWRGWTSSPPCRTAVPVAGSLAAIQRRFVGQKAFSALRRIWGMGGRNAPEGALRCLLFHLLKQAPQSVPDPMLRSFRKRKRPRQIPLAAACRLLCASLRRWFPMPGLQSS